MKPKMLTIIFFFCMAISFVAGVIYQRGWDPDSRLLAAIAQKESHGRPGEIGADGERGIYQISVRTWYDYSDHPFAEAATNPEENERVAREHLKFLKEELRDQHLKPTPYMLALAWNAGHSAVISNRIPRSSRDYAAQVISIMESESAQ